MVLQLSVDKVAKCYYNSGNESSKLLLNERMPMKDKNGLTEKQYLAGYNPEKYHRVSVTSDVLLFSLNESLSSLRILLVKRRHHPFLGMWSIPGGFLGEDESTYAAADRTLREKTGLQGMYLEQLYTYSAPDRDPRMRIVSVAYMALIPYSSEGKEKALAEEVWNASGDTDKAWFDVSLAEGHLVVKNDELGLYFDYALLDRDYESGMITCKSKVAEHMSGEKLAFDHERMLLDGILRLRGKAEYTDLPFNFLGECFTLPDLQRVYEILLGHSLFKKNFRDKIAGKTEETGRMEKSVVGNRKSALYTYKG